MMITGQHPEAVPTTGGFQVVAGKRTWVSIEHAPGQCEMIDRVDRDDGTEYRCLNRATVTWEGVPCCETCAESAKNA